MKSSVALFDWFFIALLVEGTMKITANVKLMKAYWVNASTGSQQNDVHQRRTSKEQ